MIDFFHKGPEIGIVISGTLGFSIVLYIILEFILRFTTGIFLFHKILIFFRVRRQIRKLIPISWKLRAISLVTISKKRNNLLSYECVCYVEVSSNYISGLWTNDWVKTDKWGKIIETSLLDDIKYKNSLNKEKVIQYNRDKNLERIGI
jgi:hypothetical protein